MELFRKNSQYFLQDAIMFSCIIKVTFDEQEMKKETLQLIHEYYSKAIQQPIKYCKILREENICFITGKNWHNQENYVFLRLCETVFLKSDGFYLYREIGFQGFGEDQESQNMEL